MRMLVMMFLLFVSQAHSDWKNWKEDIETGADDITNIVKDAVKGYTDDSESFGNHCGTSVPKDLCAIVFDGPDCNGWAKQIQPNAIVHFGILSPYRNDIDSVFLKSNCTFTGYQGDLEGKFIVITANSNDRFVNLKDMAETRSFEDKIESVKCACS